MNHFSHKNDAHLTITLKNNCDNLIIVAARVNVSQVSFKGDQFHANKK